MDYYHINSCSYDFPHFIFQALFLWDSQVRPHQNVGTGYHLV